MERNLREFYKNIYFYDSLPYVHQFTPSGKAAGAIYAIGSIKDAIPIVHGSAGCGFHYRYVCRRSHHPAYELQCTDLEEQDIVMGRAEKLRKPSWKQRANTPCINSNYTNYFCGYPSSGCGRARSRHIAGATPAGQDLANHP